MSETFPIPAEPEWLLEQRARRAAEPFVVEDDPPWRLDYFSGRVADHQDLPPLDVPASVVARWMAEEMQHHPGYTRYAKEAA